MNCEDPHLEVSEAYARGRNDGKAGRPLMNPYSFSSADAFEYEEGWWDGEAEAFATSKDDSTKYPPQS